MFSISSLGSKGGTGKSAVIYAIMLTLLTMNKKILAINCDSSSTTLPTLIKTGGIEGIEVLDIYDYYLYNFFVYNSSFLKKFDVVLVDLKGEELRDQDISLLFDIIDVFIMPVMASVSGMPAAFSLLEKASTLGVPMKKIYIIYNLLGYNDKSESYTKIRHNLLEYAQSIRFNIVSEAILPVTNMDDKLHNRGILGIKKNAEIISNLVNKLLKDHESAKST